MIQLNMPKKSLKETNPYLKDPELGKALLYQSVSSSTAVEGVLTKYPKLSKATDKEAESCYLSTRALSVLRITDSNIFSIGL